ncbi:MAG: DUF167 domain-containing protein [Actinomycetia bacterium]|nr:DUF167 domain-containing protein [Actinomycetes bacterium]MCP4225185.1 DUF167 domain-containing protein [Actinomycetes bacterium]MCP5030506.1 DUF167 domain-containing protein [Actinomycetes bacterium]
MRFEIRVKPRARANRVGGSWGEHGALLVEVQAPAVDGKANRAVETAVAKAFSVRRSQVTIVAGHKNRSKVIEIDTEGGAQPEKIAQLLTELVAVGGGAGRPPTD